MPVRLLAVFLGFIAGFTAAQGENPLEIHGVITEPGLNLGVPGAEVTLFEFALDAEKTVVRKPVATALTDASGKFQFRAEHSGRYFVEARREGYRGNPGSPVELDGTRPPAALAFSMSRPAELGGRIVDEEGKPVPGLSVAIHGQEPGIPLASAVTDKDGSFTFAKLQPGDVVLFISPQPAEPEVESRRLSPESVTTEFTDNDLAAVDEDYETSYWLGVDEFRLASKIPLRPGAAVSVGTITVRRVRYYRAHVFVSPRECAADESWVFAAIAGSGVARDYQSVPCGRDFLVKNLRPGAYNFALANQAPDRRRDPEGASWALAPVEITDRNVELRLDLVGGSDVSVRLIPAEGAAPPKMDTVRIALVPATGIGAVRPMESTDGAGKFMVRNVQWPRQRLFVQGLPTGYYVQETRVNGNAADPRSIELNPPAPAQLEIVINDKPASLTGTVMDGDRPAGRAQVIALKSPFDANDPFADGMNGRIAEQGKFQISGLAPGEYRVLAVAPPISASQIPQLLENSTRVVLERGGAQEITIKLTHP